ncbi:Lysophospholipase L1 [Alteromonadaceae bacterium Bs31]|nr:Lysophospholipase L1 [Alteromonadaceae bacterium Bs31]
MKYASYILLLSSLILIDLSHAEPTKMPQQIANVVLPTNSELHRLGRIHFLQDQSAILSYPGSGFQFQTNATSLSVIVHSSGEESYMALRIDNEKPRKILLSSKPQEYLLLTQEQASFRRIEFVHNSESWHGKVTIKHFVVKGEIALAQQDTPKRNIVFIGDSVTCGEGAGREGNQDCNKNNSWWSVHQSYGWLTGEALKAEVQLVCYGGRGLIRSWDGRTNELNGPDFYELSIAEHGAPPWNHSSFSADAVVVSLGTNDFNLGIGALPTEQEFVPPYIAFLKKILADYPQAQVIITEGSIVNDGDPSRPQKTVLRRYLSLIQNQVNSKRVHTFNASYFPGDKCDGHPTGPQHKKMSEELATFLKQKMHW